MGLFDNILKKLGIERSEEEAAPETKAAPAARGKPAPSQQRARPKPRTGAAAKGKYMSRVEREAARTPAPISVVDVMSKLEGMAAANPQKLNWKESIVDLLKLLELDSSYEARRELAIELKCPAENMGDSVKMNTWLHKTVLQKIAENGGNIPKELLD